MTARAVTARQAMQLAEDLRTIDTLDDALALTQAHQRHRARQRIRRSRWRSGASLAAAALAAALAGAFVTDALATAAHDAVQARAMAEGVWR